MVDSLLNEKDVVRLAVQIIIKAYESHTNKANLANPAE